MLALLSVLGILSGFLIIDSFNDDESSDGADASDDDGASPTGDTGGGASPTGDTGDGLEDSFIPELTFVGSSGFDEYTGTDANELIIGQNGADDLDGQAGDDLIYGGEGDDVLYGGEDDDILLGGTGEDDLLGGEGVDTLIGGPDDDLLMGEAGADVLSGWAGNDFMTGGDGDDELYGNEGNDFIIGGDGADILKGADGDDVLIGVEDTVNDLSYNQAKLWMNGVDPSDNPGVEFSYNDTDIGDVLDGGAGNDILALGNGDIGTGGEGADGFNVVSWINEGEEATITDFDATEDAIIVAYPAGTTVPEIGVETDGDDAQIFADGKLIAVVIGGASTVTLAAIGDTAIG